MKAVLHLSLLCFCLFAAYVGSIAAQPPAASRTTARIWNDELLAAIRLDFARPTVHARNLYHTSATLYDAYTIVGGGRNTVLMGQTRGDYTLNLGNFPTPAPAGLAAARREAMSYAAYRLLRYRFGQSPGRRRTWERIDSVMTSLGYDIRNSSTNYANGDAAALGNAIAFEVIAYGNNDGANDANGYALEYYQPLNPPLVVNAFGNPDIIDVDRWQPLKLTTFIDQSGNVIEGSEQQFVGAEWGNVVPFALGPKDLKVYERDGHNWNVYHDPGPPPLMKDPATRELMMRSNEMVVRWSGLLDPDDGEIVDISPGAIGGFPDPLPTREQYFDFYDERNGGDNAGGLDLNPFTGKAYEPNLVRRGDYYRVLAEFWADGPSSETPPGHWFTILNYVLDQPDFEFRWRGQGDRLDREAYEVQAYVTLGGAMHDVAVSTWAIKGYYDAGRPVTTIRYMAERGQRTDVNLPRYDPEGLALIPGQCEFVSTLSDPLAGPTGENIGELKVWAWRGHENIADPEVNHAGVGWLLAKEWWPFQRRTFVTPPFAGYVSGHSTFSRASAEVLTAITGSEYFPGGLGTFAARRGNFIPYEYGPTDSLTLTWATYRGASDEVSLSRIYGGIHPPYDDIPGRAIGIAVAEDVLGAAYSIFDAQAPQLVLATASLPSLTANSALDRDTLSIRLNFSEAIDTVGFRWSWPSDFSDQLVAVTSQRWVSPSELLLELRSLGAGTSYTGVFVNFSGTDLYGNALQQDRTAPLFDLKLSVGVQTLGDGLAAVLFPNPVTDVFRIRVEGAVDGGVVLTDVAGREVRRWSAQNLQAAQFEIGDLAPGAYFVTVEAVGGARASWRVLKR